MDTGLFLRGLVIGFSIAAPVGPIGLLCIRRTLAEGRAAGFVSGLGAATADAIYGGLAAFGVTLVTSVLVGQQAWLRLTGGLFLGYLGIKTFLAKPAEGSAPAGGRGFAGTYASTLLLTLTNPTTILSFAAVFAGLGVAGGRDGYAATWILVLGVFLGSALWWLALSGGIASLRARVGPPGLRWVNRLSGAIITGFGAAALWSLRS